jgi:hypothetical protein
MLGPDCDGRYDNGRLCMITDHPLNETLDGGPFPAGTTPPTPLSPSSNVTCHTQANGACLYQSTTISLWCRS